MVHNGLLSLCTTLKEYSGKDGTTSDTGGSFGSLNHRGCNMVTLTDLVIITPAPESTTAHQTIMAVMVQMAVPLPGMELLLDQQQAY
jgi:hypothetical protein